MGVNRLYSATLKWNRAAEHFKALKHECGVFMHTDPQPYAISEEVELKDGWYLARLDVRKHPDIALGLMAGDVINNVNAALDHLVYALSRTKPKGTGFPAYTDPDAYVFTSRKKKRSDRERLLSGVPDWPDRAIIDAFQPYEHEGLLDPIWLMREFANTDKHRVTHPAFANPRDFRIHPPKGCFLTIDPVDIPWPLKNGTLLYRWRVECPDRPDKANVQVRAEVDLSIAFGGTPIMDLSMIERVLERTRDIIRCF